MNKCDAKESEAVIVHNQWCDYDTLPIAGKGMLRMLFCREGNTNLVVNDKNYEVESGNLLIAFPGDVVKETGHGDPFFGSFLCLPQQLLKRFSIFTPRNWGTYSVIKEKKLLPLEASNVNLLISYFNLIEIRHKHQLITDNNEGLDSLMSIFMRDFFHIAAKQWHNYPIVADHTTPNVIFNKFMHMLYATTPQKQSLRYYADRLCVTTKHLSAICKQVAGENATTIITRCLMNEIKNRLKTTNEPIQAIAYDLGFANQSFFGKYVKARLGMTPVQYRESGCY